jgi:hypothetical protein
VVAPNGNEKPFVNSNATSVEVNEGQVAAMGGTSHDTDGDAVTFTASLGTVTPGGGGSWTWNYTTTDGPTESQFVYVTGTDAGGKKDQAIFALKVDNVAPTVSITSPLNGGIGGHGRRRRGERGGDHGGRQLAAGLHPGHAEPEHARAGEPQVPDRHPLRGHGSGRRHGDAHRHRRHAGRGPERAGRRRHRARRPPRAGHSNQVDLRAERSGKGDGRFYRITFGGDDGRGGTCSATKNVTVVHSQGHGPAIDSGLVVSSF